MDKVGRICFIVGVVVSIIAGFITANWIFVALTILGLVVGILNVTATEVQSFLLAAVGLVIISALGSAQITALPLVLFWDAFIQRYLHLFRQQQS